MLFELKGDTVYVDGVPKIKNVRLNVEGNAFRIKGKVLEGDKFILKDYIVKMNFSFPKGEVHGIENVSKKVFRFSISGNFLKRSIKVDGSIDFQEIHHEASSLEDAKNFVLKTILTI